MTLLKELGPSRYSFAPCSFFTCHNMQVYFPYLMPVFLLYHEDYESTFVSRVRNVINVWPKKKKFSERMKKECKTGTKVFAELSRRFSGAISVCPLSPRKMLWFRCHLVLSLGPCWAQDVLSEFWNWQVSGKLWGSESQALTFWEKGYDNEWRAGVGDS